MKECVSLNLPTNTNQTIHIVIYIKALWLWKMKLTNHSPKHVKIINKQSMGMLKPCDDENACTIHNFTTFEPIDSTWKPKAVEKELYCIPIRNASTRKTEIKTI